MQNTEMGQSYCITIRRSASSNIVLYSRFICLNGSITLIRAETESYDIVRFSKVTTKSLASVPLSNTFFRTLQPAQQALRKVRRVFGISEDGNQTINVKSCQSIHELRTSNLLHGEDRGGHSWKEKGYASFAFFRGQKPQASKLSKTFAARLTSFFKYSVKRLFAGCNVFLVLSVFFQIP